MSAASMKICCATFTAVFVLLVVGLAEPAAVEVGGTIFRDTTWTGAEMIQVTSSVYVVDTARLTIEPGARVHFMRGVNLTIAGELTADAGAGDRIAFTSSADTVGGLPVGGAWTGIDFQARSAGILRDCDIRYAVSGLNVTLSAPSITGCVIQNFESAGILIDGVLSNPPIPLLIDSCVIEQASPELRGTGKAVFTYRTVDLTIANSVLADCFHGLEFYGFSGYSPQFEIVDCDIRDNAMHGIYTHAG